VRDKRLERHVALMDGWPLPQVWADSTSKLQLLFNTNSQGKINIGETLKHIQAILDKNWEKRRNKTMHAEIEPKIKHSIKMSKKVGSVLYFLLIESTLHVLLHYYYVSGVYYYGTCLHCQESLRNESSLSLGHSALP